MSEAPKDPTRSILVDDPQLAATGEEVQHPVVLRLEQGGTLKARIRKGMMHAAVFRIAAQVLNLGSTVVLARLLSPGDYGLVALCTSINGFAAILTELGLAAAVVHTRFVTEKLLSTAFWLNAVSGLALTLIISACAPLIAALYDEPALVWLVVVSSLSFTLSMGAVHAGLLQRTMRFKDMGTNEVFAAVVGVVVTIAAALLGAGPYALVAGSLSTTTTSTVRYWITVRWLPRAKPGRAELRELWSFGGGLTGANIVNYWSRNADTVLLGRFAGTADLGLYNRSYNLMMLPLSQASSVLTRVLFPALVEVRDDLARFRTAWTNTVRYSLLFGIPVGIGVAVTAPAMVETLYGAKWLAMATTLALLSASVPPQLIGRNLGPVYQALGETGRQFRQSLLTTGLTVTAIVIGLPHGIEGVALALLVKSYLLLLVPLLPAMRLIDMRLVSLLASCWRLLVCGAALAAAALAARHLLPDVAAWLELLVQVAAGGLAYGVFLRLLEPVLFVAAERKIRSRVSRRRTNA